jgi:hypothetical protein
MSAVRNNCLPTAKLPLQILGQSAKELNLEDQEPGEMQVFRLAAQSVKLAKCVFSVLYRRL